MIPETEWDKILEKAKQLNRIMTIGEVDTGKSTFCRYLIKNIIKEKPICFIDSDIGQSSIGLPTTIAVKVFKDSLSAQENVDKVLIDFDKIYFVGFTTPSISPEVFIQEFTNAVKFAEKLDITTVVDTTGLISGEIGKNLKLKKISFFKPDLVVAFNRKGEINHIVNEITSETVVVEPSKNIVPRNPLKRTEYRMKKFKKYFENAKSFAVDKKLLRGQIPHGNPEGTILGIFKDEDCIALGIIEDINKENVIFSSPLLDIKTVNRVKIGHLKFIPYFSQKFFSMLSVLRFFNSFG